MSSVTPGAYIELVYDSGQGAIPLFDDSLTFTFESDFGASLDAYAALQFGGNVVGLGDTVYLPYSFANPTANLTSIPELGSLTLIGTALAGAIGLRVRKRVRSDREPFGRN